ncbi:MAG TPA: hypothetical protein VK923_03530 [Euzebyales bacterium]|nr:hypothetical protein [Euzebyales bacterium]
MARDAPDAFANPPFAAWLEATGGVTVAAMAEAAAGAEVVINATSGAASVDALTVAGEGNLAGKVLVDVANPLDASTGMPPSLTVSNTDSLAERIQRTFPAARVVKTLNTMNAAVMVDPSFVGNGDHTVFLSGDDADAKAVVSDLLTSFGWSDVIDLGDITTARGPEMLLPLWLRLFSALGTPRMQFKVVR